MKKLICLILSLVVLVSCERLDIAEGTPACVEDKIKEFNRNACESGAHVRAYTFQEATVYTFVRGNCGADFQTEVIDSDCNTLGFLGGISGNTVINGEEFSNAAFIRTVWGN